jgi:hypothetical protein
MASLNFAEVIPMGRLCYELGSLFRRQRAESFFGQSCQARLTSPYHVHIDNYGNYMAGFCGGISLGDARELDAVFQGIDLDERPVLNALVEGIGELYRLTKEFGYKDLTEGYISACHLCMDLRRHLVQQTEQFAELKPRQIYAHI